MRPLVLASTSRYRRALLERLQLPFEAVPPGVDEGAVKAQGGDPRALVEELARQKAEAVLARRPDAVVIGSDQAGVLDGRVLDKPGTEANARAQLGALRGRPHELVTAVAVAHPGGLMRFTDVTTLVMRDLDDDEIARYVAAEQPLDCAGSYKIEGLGIALFERVESRDHTAIVGLPLIDLVGALRSLGFRLP
ncbi:MAG: Maf family protein [Planctomycetota bacterium]